MTRHLLAHDTHNPTARLQRTAPKGHSPRSTPSNEEEAVIPPDDDNARAGERSPTVNEVHPWPAVSEQIAREVLAATNTGFLPERANELRE